MDEKLVRVVYTGRMFDGVKPYSVVHVYVRLDSREELRFDKPLDKAHAKNVGAVVWLRDAGEGKWGTSHDPARRADWDWYDTSTTASAKTLASWKERDSDVAQRLAEHRFHQNMGKEIATRLEPIRKQYHQGSAADRRAIMYAVVEFLTKEG